MLVASNVERLIAGYDVILDGTDTFETRYILNDAAVAAGIPVVHASVFRFEGQLTTFIPYEGPCYRCLYPTPPPAELAPSCGANGVLGVLPGTMGLLQATEVVKLVLGEGLVFALLGFVPAALLVDVDQEDTALPDQQAMRRAVLFHIHQNRRQWQLDLVIRLSHLGFDFRVEMIEELFRPDRSLAPVN
jgi:molybdopterin/thiamine biosynthesis adenylyltransferase